jgi:3-oxoadipate enol-lactonase
VRTQRGEVFARFLRHPDPEAPVVLLLHGWTASADTQWLFTYGALSERYSVVAVDHQGHGRGLRTTTAFDLAAVAADAVDVCVALGFGRFFVVGYSMGGPIALHLWRDHPDRVRGLVFAATALEFRARAHERLRWRTGRVFRMAMRAWWYPRAVRQALGRLAAINPEMAPMVGWLTAEVMRNDPFVVADAGRALSRYDARTWATGISVPTAMVLTLHDHLVSPAKQRQLAETLGAHVEAIDADHLASLAHPDRFTGALQQALAFVEDAVAQPAARR